MPSTLSRLLERNREWVAERTADDPEYFARQARKHEPHYLWIGCSDARVPANVVTRTDAGEMFVHRNVANVVVPTDNNLLAVLQFAIEVLHVHDVIVCGHEGCGGVRAAMGETSLSLVEAWLDNVRNVRRLHAAELAAIADEDARYRRLVALNVMEQVATLGRLSVVRSAWARGATLRLHGIVYDIADGVLRDLGVSRSGPATENGER
jgi:carbonic anhydrase